MITYDIALKTVRSYLDIVADDSLLILVDKKTIDFELGWVFFYQSRRFIETGNPLDALGGNAPIIIDKRDSSLHVTGTAHPIGRYLEDYMKRAVNKG